MVLLEMMLNSLTISPAVWKSCSVYTTMCRICMVKCTISRAKHGATWQHPQVGAYRTVLTDVAQRLQVSSRKSSRNPSRDCFGKRILFNEFLLWLLQKFLWEVCQKFYLRYVLTSFSMIFLNSFIVSFGSTSRNPLRSSSRNTFLENLPWILLIFFSRSQKFTICSHFFSNHCFRNFSSSRKMSVESA